MTLSDIAGWLRLSWDKVKAVVKGRLEKDYRRIGYRMVSQIAIDELYLGRTRKYIKLVMDMESARIIWVAEGRGAEALREFWRRFKLSGARLKAVAMDMSGAYACTVRAHAPHAILTFDRFHVTSCCRYPRIDCPHGICIRFSQHYPILRSGDFFESAAGCGWASHTFC